MQENLPGKMNVRAPVPPIAMAAGAIPRILVVDDDRELLKLITRVFDRIKDVEINCFSSPLEALREFLMNPHGYSLVLTDYKMPGMNGEELAAQIRSVRKDLPVVAITGSCFEFRRSDLFVKVIEKPFGPEEILKLVAEWFEGRAT